MPVEEGLAADQYSSYDPETARPTPVVEGAPPLLGEDGNVLPSFDPRLRDDFQGLMYLGALGKSFEWFGHRITIRTLFQNEVLLVPLLIKPWQATIGEAKAYTVAMVALCTQSVDGKPLPVPLGEGKDEFAWAQERFDFVQRNWFQWTIDKVYSEYLGLETKVGEVLEAMGKVSGPRASTPGSSATSDGPNDEDS